MKSSARGLCFDPRRKNYTTTSKTEPRTSSGERTSDVPESSAATAEKKRHSLGIAETGDRALSAGGPAMLPIEDGQGVEVEGAGLFPVNSVIVAAVFACRSDGDPLTAGNLCQTRAKPARLPGGKLPGLACVQRIGSRALALPGLPVVSSDHQDMVVAIAHDGKNSGRSVAVSNGRFRDRP